MSDYYTKLAFTAPFEGEILAWADALFSSVRSALTEDEEIVLDDLRTQGTDESTLEIVRRLANESDYCDAELDVERTESGRLFICSDNGDLVADLLQEVLKRFDLDMAVGFQWAFDCSKPVTDAYGGGACVVTRDNKRWMDTGRWLRDQMQAMGHGTLEMA